MTATALANIVLATAPEVEQQVHRIEPISIIDNEKQIIIENNGKVSTDLTDTNSQPKSFREEFLQVYPGYKKTAHDAEIGMYYMGLHKWVDMDIQWKLFIDPDAIKHFSTNTRKELVDVFISMVVRQPPILF